MFIITLTEIIIFSIFIILGLLILIFEVSHYVNNRYCEWKKKKSSPSTMKKFKSGNNDL